MRSQCRDSVVETRLPQGGEIEQPFYQDDAAKQTGLHPSIHSSFRPRQKTMAAQAVIDRTTVKVSRFLKRKSQTAEKAVASSVVDQAAVPQNLTSKAQVHKMTAQTRARGITDLHALNHCRVMDAAPRQIGGGF